MCVCVCVHVHTCVCIICLSPLECKLLEAMDIVMIALVGPREKQLPTHIEKIAGNSGRERINRRQWIFLSTVGMFAAAAAAAAKSLQSCPTLWDPIDGSPPGSPVPGIVQARVLEWGAIAFSSGDVY